MWKHKTKFKNQEFLGNFELDKNGKRVFKLKNKKTGRELGPWTSPAIAKRDGWIFAR